MTLSASRLASAAAPVRIAALYCFAPVPDPDATIATLRALAADCALKGTLLVAGEGINGTIAGPAAGIARMVDHIAALPGFDALSVKYAEAATPPFGRMKVRRKQEIVTMGVPGIDAARDAGERLDPVAWNRLIRDPRAMVIDTRNAYEVAIGTFDRAIDPGTRGFREFPQWFDRFTADLDPDTPIAMFCTGGIRCEKATAYAKARGFTAYHLDGGILRYLEDMDAADSLWRGECYVFDERVSVDHDLNPGQHVSCPACGHPLSPTDRAAMPGNGGDDSPAPRCPFCPA